MVNKMTARQSVSVAIEAEFSSTRFIIIQPSSPSSAVNSRTPPVVAGATKRLASFFEKFHTTYSLNFRQTSSFSILEID
ncbi:unnamed protein product [Haemonchus placei]|uniref:Ovule protein n=1 Tax=Haemonchus placei TaxID=6290 RepID=A0A0N4WB91_HAEPC|nr:unnamed protein product [Haemonchus placei]